MEKSHYFAYGFGSIVLTVKDVLICTLVHDTFNFYEEENFNEYIQAKALENVAKHCLIGISFPLSFVNILL